MTRFSGSTRRSVSASRKSATDLPEKSCERRRRERDFFALVFLFALVFRFVVALLFEADLRAVDFFFLALDFFFAVDFFACAITLLGLWSAEILCRMSRRRARGRTGELPARPDRERRGARLRAARAPRERPGRARAGGRSRVPRRAPVRPSSACRRSNASGSSVMRRLRSPPKTSGTSADHAQAARAARSTSRAAAAGTCAVACRFAAVRSPCSGCASRTQMSRRRSGSSVSVRRRVSRIRQPERARIWFEPPSPGGDQVRVPLGEPPAHERRRSCAT